MINDLELNNELEKNAVYASYIENNFLNSFLSTEMDYIVETISNLKLADNIDESMIIDALLNIQIANIGSSAKLESMLKIINIYKEMVAIDESNEDAILLEYAGDEEKNKILRELMQKMEICIQEWYDEIDFYLTCIDNIDLEIKKEVNKKQKINLKNLEQKILSIYKKFQKEISSKKKKNSDDNFNNTLNELEKICNDFDIEFNDIVIDDKKAFDQKLLAAANKIQNNKKVRKWLIKPFSASEQEYINPEAFDNLKNNIDKLHIIAGEKYKNKVNNIVDMLDEIINYSINNFNSYCNNIIAIRQFLGLGKVNSIFFMVFNDVIKTKKD